MRQYWGLGNEQFRRTQSSAITSITLWWYFADHVAYCVSTEYGKTTQMSDVELVKRASRDGRVSNVGQTIDSFPVSRPGNARGGQCKSTLTQ